MSIMREKPIICKDWFDVPTLTDTRDGKKLDILSSVNAWKFFEDLSNELRTRWNLSVLAPSRNNRVYPGAIWDWINPFKYPRFQLFQIENRCLLCKDLIK